MIKNKKTALHCEALGYIQEHAPKIVRNMNPKFNFLAIFETKSRYRGRSGGTGGKVSALCMLV